ncbi:multiple monosaccharide ABC transporter permease [Mobiluncus mulieris]|uniref:multiple monosaccharide ABC transporter permease n=1 Tax=Mobiluncus mulieris TaxID=2052 RepID=UPI00146FEBE6|nr:multiple monosaccharide ABC transporter permease [Mobiluncus mulieris]MCV0009365.1 sugar ABC transporter permease [Mobiluncus mulieris]NMW60920.1 sugar ABC transporter permease [Mobiluncus mulieris]
MITKTSTWKNNLNLRNYGLSVALIGIIILFQILTGGRLLVPDNIVSLIQQNAYVMILAIGMMMVIIAGHIDLSVGSIVAMVGGVVGIAMTQWNISWPVAILLALLVGVLVGMWQGYWVAYVGIPAFIATLGGMLIFRGFAQLLVGQTISGFPQEFITIGNGALPNFLGFTNTPTIGYVEGVTILFAVLAIVAYIVLSVRKRSIAKKHELNVEFTTTFWIKVVTVCILVGIFAYLIGLSTDGMPVVLLVLAVLVGIFSFVLRSTRFGRNVYAIGGNYRAAELSGVNVKRDTFVVFVLMGVLSALAGVVVTSRAGAAVAAAGMGYELDAIAACFIGGAAVEGGVGKISGAMIGALVMGVLNIGLSILAVDPAWQQAIKGLVLIIAVAFDLMNKRK